MRRLRVPTVVLALAIVTGCTAHTRPRTGGEAAPAGTPSAAAGASGSSTGAAASAPSGSGAGGAADRCHTSQLRAAFVAGDSAAGQRYAKIALTNRSATACVLYGFGGMQLLDAGKQPIPTKIQRVNTSAPRPINLQPGASALSQLHWGAVPGSGEPVSGQCEPTPAFAKVTPPDEQDYLLVPWTLGPVCEHGRIEQQPYR